MVGPDLTVTEGDSGLRVAHLRKSYRKRVVIRDVSMELMRGEVVALLGPNGSGKTTCFYMIVGLVEADAGRIDINEADITHLPMHGRAQRGIGDSSITRSGQALAIESVGAGVKPAEHPLERPRTVGSETQFLRDRLDIGGVA